MLSSALLSSSWGHSGSLVPMLHLGRFFCRNAAAAIRNTKRRCQHFERLQTEYGEALFIGVCLSLCGAVCQPVVVVCQTQHDDHGFRVFHCIS